MAATVAGVLLTGLLGSRPAANAVSVGALYAATDAGVVYQSDGVSAWSVWATFAGGSTAAIKVYSFDHFI